MIPALLITFFVLLVFGIPISVCLGLSSVIGVVFFSDLPLSIISSRMFVSMDSFPMLAIAFFTFAGSLMGSSGISRRLISFSYSLLGGIRGGLAHVNVLASMLFAGISGSAVADTAGIGGILIPEMIEKKYSRGFSAAVTGISSTIGIIIPPSIPMVVMGSITGMSVGKLFMGGIIPGIIIGVLMMVVSYFVALKEQIPKEDVRVSLKLVLSAAKDAFWAILMIFVVMGSIVLGIASPTEAGAVAVIYALIIGVFIHKELRPADILKSLKETAITVSRVYLVIGTAGLFTWLMTMYGFPRMVSDFMLSITHSPTVLMILFVLLFLVVTTFMEGTAAQLLLVPVLYPIAVQVGINPVFFGVLIIVSIGIGLVTPPVGLCLYIASDIAGIKMGEGAKAVLPFIGSTLLAMAILFVFPQLITWLPSLMK